MWAAWLAMPDANHRPSLGQCPAASTSACMPCSCSQFPSLGRMHLQCSALAKFCFVWLQMGTAMAPCSMGWQPCRALGKAWRIMLQWCRGGAAAFSMQAGLHLMQLVHGKHCCAQHILAAGA